MAMTPYNIIDMDFLEVIEDLYPGWSVWEVEATLDDGTVMKGVCQSDGVGSWDAESFEPDEET